MLLQHDDSTINIVLVLLLLLLLLLYLASYKVKFYFLFLQAGRSKCYTVNQWSTRSLD